MHIRKRSLDHGRHLTMPLVGLFQGFGGILRIDKLIWQGSWGSEWFVLNIVEDLWLGFYDFLGG